MPPAVVNKLRVFDCLTPGPPSLLLASRVSKVYEVRALSLRSDNVRLENPRQERRVTINPVLALIEDMARCT